LFHDLNAAVSKIWPQTVETVTEPQSESEDIRMGQSVPLAFSAATWFSKTKRGATGAVTVFFCCAFHIREIASCEFL